MRRRRAVVVAGVTLSLAAAVGVFAIARDHDHQTYSLPAVRLAFAATGMPLTHSIVQDETEAVLAPFDDRFTVIVFDSDSHARSYYRQYTDGAAANPGTSAFQRLAGNVLIESDGSNSSTPLPTTIRRRIDRAVARLSVGS